MILLPVAGQLVALVLAASALIAAAVADLRSYQIPNRYAVSVVLAYLLFALGLGWQEALGGLAIGAATFAFGIVLFARNWLGGGDVKLLAAIALWVPPPLLAGFALATSLAGAGLSVAMLSPLRRHLPAAPVSPAHERALHQPIPFAIAIAAGGLFVLLKRVTG